jgi:hypothetical protein
MEWEGRGGEGMEARTGDEEVAKAIGSHNDRAVGMGSGSEHDCGRLLLLLLPVVAVRFGLLLLLRSAWPRGADFTRRRARQLKQALAPPAPSGGPACYASLVLRSDQPPPPATTTTTIAGKPATKKRYGRRRRRRYERRGRAGA